MRSKEVTMCSWPCHLAKSRESALFMRTFSPYQKFESRKISPSGAAVGLFETHSLNLPDIASRQMNPLEGYDRIYVEDPFGNRIELMEPLSS